MLPCLWQVFFLCIVNVLKVSASLVMALVFTVIIFKHAAKRIVISCQMLEMYNLYSTNSWMGRSLKCTFFSYAFLLLNVIIPQIQPEYMKVVFKEFYH